MQNLYFYKSKVENSFGFSKVLLVLFFIITANAMGKSNEIPTAPVGGEAPVTEEVSQASPGAPELPKSPNEAGSIIPFQYNDPRNYVQIGYLYFIIGTRLDARGYNIPDLQPWKYSQLKRDFSNNPNDLALIPRYFGMTCYPSHLEYHESVGYYYNTYCRLGWAPTEGYWPNIEIMLRHIFGEQFEYGLDYLELLYMHPTQKLPILVLVSKERNTGKTTFLNFLKLIFGPNMAFVTNDTMRSKFNSERAGKLIIACDETFLNKKEDSERLKALSTAEQTYIEFKGKDRYEIDNFSKIILCSNNVTAPVYIDFDETRYWVREVPVLSKDIPNFLRAMEKEIPAFLYSLIHRTLHVQAEKSRMWFHPDDLRTQALLRIMQTCRPTAELELAEFILEKMDQYSQDVLRYTLSDLNSLLKAEFREIKDFHHIISKIWNVPHASSKMAYDCFAPFVNESERHKYGRYYTFKRNFIESLLPSETPAAQAATDAPSTIFSSS